MPRKKDKVNTGIIADTNNQEIEGLKKINIKRNLIITISILAVVLVFTLNLSDISDIAETLHSLSIFHFSIALIVMFLYWIFSAISFQISLKLKKINLKKIDVFTIASSTLFYNAITPFSSGGQPFQIYYMKRKGVEVTDGLSCVTMNFIIYQIALTIISLLALLFYFGDLKNVQGFSSLVIIGTLVNTLVLLFLLFASFSQYFHKVVVANIVKLILKFKILKKLFKIKDDFEQRTEKTITTFQTGVFELLKNKKGLLLLFCSRVIESMLLYIVPFFILKSIGVELTLSSLPLVIAMSSFALILTAWVPTPGVSGGAELAFFTLFTQIPGVTEGVAIVGLILWRLVTYYLTILWGLISVYIFERSFK